MNRGFGLLSLLALAIVLQLSFTEEMKVKDALLAARDQLKSDIAEPVTIPARSINALNITILVGVTSSLWDCGGSFDIVYLQPWQTYTSLNIPSCQHDIYFNYSLSNGDFDGVLQPTYYYDVDGVGETKLYTTKLTEIFGIGSWEYRWVSLYGYLFIKYDIQTSGFTYCTNSSFSYACNGHCYTGPGVCCNGTMCAGNSCCDGHCCTASEKPITAVDLSYKRMGPGMVSKELNGPRILKK